MLDEYMWEKFTQSGNIGDYLVYTELTAGSQQLSEELETTAN